MATQADSSALENKLCQRCRTNISSVKARGDLLCTDCFVNYVQSKVAKRMDPYKYRSNVPTRKVLLALSLGVSSLTLLHILSKQLRTQAERIGRYGYDLHICIMNDTSVFSRNPQRDEEDQERVRKVFEMYFDDREKWPMMKEISFKSTEECFNKISNDDSELRDLITSCQTSDRGSLPAQWSSLSYEKYIASLPSTSARADMNTVLTRRFLIRHAQEIGCDTILWGDSTTRLAERTLAETAKGRGFSLPWQTADGPTPFNLTFMFPMRDLLRKEITAYAGLTDPPLTTLAKPEVTVGVPQASSKDATIDALMAQYFESVEENFPSIVTNVVRTSNRLKPSTLAGQKRCQICALPVSDGADGLHGWAGSQEDDEAFGSSAGFYCYGCARSTKGRAV